MNIQEQNFFLMQMLQKNQEIVALQQEIHKLRELIKQKDQEKLSTEGE